MNKQVTTKKLWLMRLAAVGFGVLLLLCCEGILRLTGIGRLVDSGDPFVGFSESIPLFELNESGTRFETARSKLPFFRPESFRATKADKEFRIFCLGGSTVQGRPYAIETSFTTWLELSLKAADPSVDWKTVNCGGISYASYRLIPVLKESLSHEPDLFIVYSGHNEFLEDRTYADIKSRAEWLKGVQEFAVKFHLYNLARQLTQREAEPVSNEDLPKEVDALLDHEGGLAKYHRDDEWHRAVTEHYEFNLRRMIRIASDANVPLILINPTSNVRDIVPFKAEVNSDLDTEQAERFKETWEQAKQMSWDDVERKKLAVESVLDLDPRHAHAWYLLAKVLEAKGQFAEAKIAYLRAKDEDLCPLRMTEKMHEAVLRVAKQTGTTLLDARQLFDARSEHEIPGDDDLIDHVHPRIDGHQLLGDMIYQELLRQGLVTETAEFESRRKTLYNDNFALLPDNYFPEAKSRLEGLNRWARGRVGQLSPEAPPPAKLD